MDKIKERIEKLKDKWEKELEETSEWALFTGDDMRYTLEEFIDDLEDLIKEEPKQLFEHEGYMVSEPWDV